MAQDFDLHVREVDIERSVDDDLSSAQLWDEIFADIRDGKYDVVIMSPPCGTWSRVRFQWQLHPGPRPQRNKSWPWGFPWLSAANKKKVEVANYFVSQTIQAAHFAHAAGTCFLIEHPEDLGSVNGESPASIWQLDEMRDLQVATNATTWAIFQCTFGADTSKPTRFLSTIPGIKARYAKWPSFDTAGKYMGPLPCRCKHKRHVRRLIGKDAHGRWVTGPAAAYPPGLCKYLASLVASVLRKGDHHSEAPPSQPPQPSHAAGSSAGSSSVADVVHTAAAGDDARTTSATTGTEPVEQPAAQLASVVDDSLFTVSKRHWGRPMMVEWSGEEREIIDGFGLCSPNRWEPASRCFGDDPHSRDLNFKVHELLKSFVHEQLGDLRTMAFKLATGKLEGSPFDKDSIDAVRKRWAALLPMPANATKRAEGQPFLLDMMAQTLKIQGDPDYEILVSHKDSFASGVPVGYGEPIPPAPEVFRLRTKQSNLDSSEYMEEARNYKSAVENKEGLEAKFREDESKGMMFPTTMGVLKEKYPGQPILVAAMGAIKKPDGSVRPIHDGTHFVQVNNGIQFTDKLDYPGPPDVAGAVRAARDTLEAMFTVSADIKAAHRLVKIRESDWRLLVCKADSDSPVCWVNRVGTFGVSSAPYWWSRLFGLTGRLVARVLLDRWVLQLVYVDDLHMVAVGEQKFETLWMALAAYEILGTPFGYKKFAGGLDVQFVGYRIDYVGTAVGISEARGQWLLEFLRTLKRDKYTVHVHRFAEFLGRLGFTCRVLLWLKPHLAPLYSWASAVSKSTVATAPRLVKLVCMFLESQFEEQKFMFSCARPRRLDSEVFRTDAKCERNLVVLGGYHFPDGRWFSIRVTPKEAPFLFKESGESEWASAPAELLSVLAALQLFGYLEPRAGRTCIRLWIQSGTDNRSIDFLSKKNSTTRWPLTLVNMQMSHCLMKAGVRVSLSWRPRDENTLADDLTNSRFEKVDSCKRVCAEFSELGLSLLFKLWEARDEYLDRDSWAMYGKGRLKPEKTDWG
eukprot:s4687_g6.t1